MSDVSASEKQDEAAPIEEALKNERYELLRRLEDLLETPMLALAFVWLALLVVELIWGESLLFEIIGTIIWVIFILDFAMKFTLAPHKVAYLRHNWLIAMSLLLLVTFTGAAGMYAFENAAPGGMKSYGEALWWTAMVVLRQNLVRRPRRHPGRRAAAASRA